MTSSRLIANEMNVVFGSQLCNDHVCAAVIVTHGTPEGYVGMEAAFDFKVPSERMAEAMQLLNLLNGLSSLFVYSICQCCNGVSMNSSLFLPDGSLPKEKFKRLIHEMLEDAYLVSPLIAEIIKGGDAESLYERFINDHRSNLSMPIEVPKKAEIKILADIESVLLGLELHIGDENRLEHGFHMGFELSDRDFPLHMVIASWRDGKGVTMQLIPPPLVVPDEKIPALTELANWMNKGSHLDNVLH